MNNDLSVWTTPRRLYSLAHKMINNTFMNFFFTFPIEIILNNLFLINSIDFARRTNAKRRGQHIISITKNARNTFANLKYAQSNTLKNAM